MPARRCATRSTSPAMPSAGAISAIGSPSTTIWRGSPPPPPPGGSAPAPRAPPPPPPAPAGGCCPNHRPPSSPRKSAPPQRPLPAPPPPAPPPLPARALRRTLAGDVDEFPQDVLELMAYFRPEPGQPVRAVPGAGLNVPVWILGSSLYGAQLAAALGLPFAFASHFAPDQMMAALQLYRGRFRPSEHAAKPCVMLGFTSSPAPAKPEPSRPFTSLQQ